MTNPIMVRSFIGSLLSLEFLKLCHFDVGSSTDAATAVIIPFTRGGKNADPGGAVNPAWPWASFTLAGCCLV